MNPVISKEDLEEKLADLRETMTDGRNFPPSHVHFLNTMSFYMHFAKCPCGDTTVADTLHGMKHCIPLALTKTSLEQFLSACKQPESSAFTKQYLEHCKADFLLLLYHSAKKPDHWQALVQLCNGLRLQTEKETD